MITIGPYQVLSQAINVLEVYNIGGLVVFDPLGDFVGIITERESIRNTAGYGTDFNVEVREVMIGDVITGMPQDGVNAVAHAMIEEYFQYLRILQDRI